jgi:hypothetical protein
MWIINHHWTHRHGKASTLHLILVLVGQCQQPLDLCSRVPAALLCPLQFCTALLQQSGNIWCRLTTAFHLHPQVGALPGQNLLLL